MTRPGGTPMSADENDNRNSLDGLRSEWDDLDWDFIDEEIAKPDGAVACSLENPETCEACD